MPLAAQPVPRAPRPPPPARRGADTDLAIVRATAGRRDAHMPIPRANLDADHSRIVELPPRGARLEDPTAAARSADTLNAHPQPFDNVGLARHAVVPVPLP
jgi:hypothetical protein